MPVRFMLSRLAAALLLSGILLSACIPGAALSSGEATPEPYFRPPAPLASATSEPLTVSGEQPEPGAANQPDAECQNNLTFLRDITIPDGTRVSPLSTMDKRWEVENSGSCGWTEAFRMRLIAGPAMGAQPEQALFPARSGTRTVLRILFEAPEQPGDYRSAWQAYSPEGEPFGDPFFIDIVVEGTGGTPTVDETTSP